jgi:hypothetical protein
MLALQIALAKIGILTEAPRSAETDQVTAG